jgi:hypothetical protein
MATDSTLVKGAYDANKGYNIDRTGISKAINKGAQDLGTSALKKKEAEAKVKADKLIAQEKAAKAEAKTAKEKREWDLKQEKHQFEVGKEANKEYNIWKGQFDGVETDEDKQRILEGIDPKLYDITWVENDKGETVPDIGAAWENLMKNPKAMRKAWESGEGAWLQKRKEQETLNAYNQGEDGNGAINGYHADVENVVEDVAKNIDLSEKNSLGKRVLDKISAGVQGFKSTLERIGENHRDRKEMGFMKNIDEDVDSFLGNVYGGNVKLETRGDEGELVVKVPGEYLNSKGFKEHADIWGIKDGYMSVGDLNRLVETWESDSKSHNNINALMINQIDKAVNSGPKAKFNAANVQQSIKQIVSKGNTRSLANDDVFGGTSFFDDLEESLNGITYRELGVDPMVYDKDGDGVLTANDKLSDSERGLLIEELSRREDMLEDMLVDYFTKTAKMQWDNNHIGPEEPEVTLSNNALSAMTQNSQVQSKGRLDEKISKDTFGGGWIADASTQLP